MVMPKKNGHRIVYKAKSRELFQTSCQTFKTQKWASNTKVSIQAFQNNNLQKVPELSRLHCHDNPRKRTLYLYHEAAALKHTFYLHNSKTRTNFKFVPLSLVFSQTPWLIMQLKKRYLNHYSTEEEKKGKKCSPLIKYLFLNLSKAKETEIRRQKA